jgi:hypothetical protein
MMMEASEDSERLWKGCNPSSTHPTPHTTDTTHNTHTEKEKKHRELFFILKHEIMMSAHREKKTLGVALQQEMMMSAHREQKKITGGYFSYKSMK